MLKELRWAFRRESPWCVSLLQVLCSKWLNIYWCPRPPKASAKCRFILQWMWCPLNTGLAITTLRLGWPLYFSSEDARTFATNNFMIILDTWIANIIKLRVRFLKSPCYKVLATWLASLNGRPRKLSEDFKKVSNLIEQYLCQVGIRGSFVLIWDFKLTSTYLVINTYTEHRNWMRSSFSNFSFLQVVWNVSSYCCGL